MSNFVLGSVASELRGAARMSCHENLRTRGIMMNVGVAIAPTT